MAIKVVSWNIEGRLTRFSKAGRGSPEHIAKNIEKLDGDIVFLPEASDDDRIDARIIDRLHYLGYEILTVAYGETEDRRWKAESMPNMKLLSKLPLRNFEQIRLGGIRNALVADIDDPATGRTVRFFGLHLDDRNEANRLKQLDDLLPLLQASSMPVVVMGDFNAMHAGSVHAGIYRSKAIAILAKYWPHERTKDGWCRLIEMASGNTLARLESVTGLIDADSSYGPTETPKMRSQEWMPSIRLGQIDHIFVSKDIAVTNFKISPDGGADHRAISATIDTQPMAN